MGDLKQIGIAQRGSVADEGVRTAVEYFAERVAHDVNNLITPLLAYPDLLIPSLANEKSVAIVRAMQDAAQRALDVMERLSALSGRGMPAAESFDMCRIVSQALDAVKAQADPADAIVFEEVIAANPTVHMQREVFVRALEALLENAMQAVRGVDGTRKITVTVDTVEMDGSIDVGGDHIPEGVYARLSIADTGLGMRKEALQHSIEPFVCGFEEKRGCGAGLGLSVAYCGLRRNGAFLEMCSAVDTGTCAHVYIPVRNTSEDAKAYDHDTVASETTSASSQTASPEKDALAETARSSNATDSLRVLVVDDESSIANLFKMILENFIPGVTVDCAGNGAEALDHFKRLYYPVLVMDLHMPVMDGQASFFEIKKYCQQHQLDMPAVVFCTGYAPQAPLRKAIEPEGHHVILSKPVRSETLIEAVQERLPSLSMS